MSTVKAAGDSFLFSISANGSTSSRRHFAAEGSYFAKTDMSDRLCSWTQLDDHSCYEAQARNETSFQEEGEQEDQRNPSLPPMSPSQVNRLRCRQVISYSFNGEKPISCLLAQKIESYRNKEMMEMINRLPEVELELSLTDLVEHSLKVKVEEEKMGKNGEFLTGMEAEGTKETAEKRRKRKTATEKMRYCLRILFPVSHAAVAAFEQQNQLILVDDNQKSREDEGPKMDRRVAHRGRNSIGCYPFFSVSGQKEKMLKKNHLRKIKF
ncbi:hypothetical protein AXF42_Ash021135 [Apostasia shenzhenica]|uniref:Uncharacterized protein n=1 Tax=Apostasia shenzhenica TaxID=1088818 RepID=A0A2I0ADW3_9ASPA|nr:hypothetical protein AXF42_Ash021135 [Apostasia shenzhenica]